MGELKGGGQVFRLLLRDAEAMELDPRVQGEIRPFSMTVRSVAPGEGDILTIRNHLFFRGEKAYMLTGIPDAVNPSDHVLGERHISRLDKFPYSSLEQIDLETWGRLRRNRGTSVGTIEGLAENGFVIRLAAELDEVGLPLAAASYLLYSS